MLSYHPLNYARACSPISFLMRTIDYLGNEKNICVSRCCDLKKTCYIVKSPEIQLPLVFIVHYLNLE